MDGARVANDDSAHDAAESLDAIAFTVGQTIYLGRDAPAPGTAAGESLLAHELAHVLQQADAVSTPTEMVSVPGEPHERAATAASSYVTSAAGRAGSVGHTGGVGHIAGIEAPGGKSAVPPAVQRQQADQAKTGPTPPVMRMRPAAEPGTLSRAELSAVLERYFERVQAQQGGRSVRMTDDVRFALRRVFAGDPLGEMPLLVYLNGTTFPSTSAALAAEVAKRMPDPVARARVAHLTAGPAAPEEKGTLARVTDLVAATSPSISPAQQQSQWAFDQAAKDVRRGESVIGPFGLDLQRAAAIGAGLPKALAGPAASGPAARSYPAVDAAVAGVPAGSLTPAEVAGTPAADSYADAQEVAGALARDLDVAQQSRRATISLRLGANYLKAKDRDVIIAEVERIIALVRAALPHHASAVDAVDLYFGQLRVRRVEAGSKAP